MLAMQNFPYITQSNPVPFVILEPEQFIEDFYLCKFNIPTRDALPPYIHHLILQHQANPKKAKVVAQLKFLYICLTQLHFHVTCSCRAFEGKRHNYYDHLYALYKIVRKSVPPVLGENFSDYFTFNFKNEPILLSMAITCFPMFDNVYTYHARSLGDKSYENNYQALRACLDRFMFLGFGLPFHQKTRSLYIRYSEFRLSGRHHTKATPESQYIFGSPERESEITFNNFDFRGSEMKSYQSLAVYLNDGWLPRSLQNADCRGVNFIDCPVQQLDVTGTDFTGACLNGTEILKKECSVLSAKPNPTPKIENNCATFNYPFKQLSCVIL